MGTGPHNEACRSDTTFLCKAESPVLCPGTVQACSHPSLQAGELMSRLLIAFSSWGMEALALSLIHRLSPLLPLYSLPACADLALIQTCGWSASISSNSRKVHGLRFFSEVVFCNDVRESGSQRVCCSLAHGKQQAQRAGGGRSRCVPSWCLCRGQAGPYEGSLPLPKPRDAGDTSLGAVMLGLRWY